MGVPDKKASFYLFNVKIASPYVSLLATLSDRSH